MRAERLMLLLLALWILPVSADESPDMEMIEFLGEFTGEDGEWVDPLDLYLLDEDASELLEEEAVQEEDDEDERTSR